MKKKTQILMIHGGMTFKTQKDYLKFLKTRNISLENKIPKKALSVYLVCPPYDDTLIGEDLAGGFNLKSDISLLEKNCKNLYLFFSKDDDCVPVSHADKYAKKLTNANIVIYNSKNGHFNITEFPEIVKMIKNDVK